MPPDHGVHFDLLCDVAAKDDDGNSWALVDLDDFRPSTVYPGALITAGYPDTASFTFGKVIRTELVFTEHPDLGVLVTFIPVPLRTLDLALFSGQPR